MLERTKENYEKLNYFNFVKPFYIKLKVDGKMLYFQIDTGSTIAEPLYQLLKDNVPYLWGAEQVSVFSHIKKALLSKKVLLTLIRSGH